jgi:hypothetical protein
MMVAATATACGDDGPGNNPRPDSGTGSPDAETGDTTPVQLTITRDGAGVAGVKVHFQRPDSSLYTTAMTDTSGVASAPMPSGGFVTAVGPYSEPGDSDTTLYTFAGAKAGDQLVLKEAYPDSGGELAITAPIDSSTAVTQYLFSSPCDSSTEPEAGNTTNTTYTMYLDERCEPNTDLLIASLDANDEIVKYTYSSNLATASGSTNLSTATLTAPVAKTYTFTNIPASGMGVGIFTMLSSQKGRVLERETMGEGTSVTATIKQAAFANAQEAIGAMTGAPYGMHGMFDFGMFSATPFTTDVGARLLKEATSSVTFDAATQTASWTEAATGVTPDFAAAEADRYTDTNGIYWNLVGPYTGGSVEFPKLPVDGTDYNFKAGDEVDVEINIGKVPGGWDAVRPKFFTLEGPEDLASGGAPGQVTFQFISTSDPGLRRLATSTTAVKRKQPFAAWKIRRRM